MSFRPGRPFKGVDRETLADIMAVPLFVKLPGQQDPVVSDRNVQSIDVMPTIAAVLKATLPWQPEGRSALAPDPPSATKFIRYLNASRQTTVDVEELAAIRRHAVERKFQLFAADNTDMLPAIADHPELIGRDLNTLHRSDDGPLQVVVDRPAQYLRFDPAAATVVGLLSGRVLENGGRRAAARLAIAVNGKVCATTRTYRGDHGGAEGVWTAFVPPRHFRPGANEVTVFVIRDEPAGVRLERAYASSARPEMVNLASRGARDRLHAA